MRRFEWIQDYDAVLNNKIHDWTFLEDKDWELSLNRVSLNTIRPTYLILCEKCGMRGIIRNFYLIISNKNDEKLTCNEFLIKNIID